MAEDALLRYVKQFCAESPDGWAVESDSGEGKSAQVYKISGPSGEAALKIYHPKFFVGEHAPIEARRIIDQVSLKGHDHPSLIQIFDAGQIDDTYYLLMEYLPWTTLSKSLTKIDPSSFHNIISQVASAAQFLETRGFVHRDIKPDNILISLDSNFTKLLDLGVMRPISPDEPNGTDHGLKRPFVATAQYSSPEYLFRLKEPTADLWKGLTFYQLGSVLHDLIMRQPIFQDEVETGNRYNVAMAVYQKTPEIQNDRVDPALIALARNCLRKDGKQRLDRVGWDQFHPSGEGSLDEARRRLSLGASRSSSQKHCDPNREKERRLVELDAIADMLDEHIRNIMGESGFPPARYRKVHSGDHVITIIVTFKPIHADYDSTYLNFMVTVCGEPNVGGITEVFLSGSLSQGDIIDTISDPGQSIWTALPSEFDGDADALSSRLDARMIELYDRADQRTSAFEGDDSMAICFIE